MAQPSNSDFTVRFGRLPRRGLILGFSAPRVCCLAAATVVLLPALFSAGASGAMVTFPVWMGFVLLSSVRWGGRPVVETLPTAAHFALRRTRGQTMFRARPEKPRPKGTLALPGDAARLRIITASGMAAMVHDPHDQTLTAVGLVRHPAYVLLSPEEQERRVHCWGRTLAALANTSTGVRLQILEVTLPDAGRGITGWWDTHRVSDEGWSVKQ